MDQTRSDFSLFKLAILQKAHGMTFIILIVKPLTTGSTRKQREAGREDGTVSLLPPLSHSSNL